MDGNIGDTLKLSEAVQRAKAIAAKIGGNFGGVPGTPSMQAEQKTMAQAPTVLSGLDSGLNNSGGVKRPLEGGNGEAEPPVKSAAMENDPFGAQLALQKLEAANAMKEDYFIPHNMVGLIIGRKGEQIQKLQEESKCNLQIETESNTDGMRPCTLTGSPEAIASIKAKIDQILNHATGVDGPGGTQEEVQIPADKVGLVIGKGGETIRNLQVKHGVRMAMIQDGTEITGSSKPLRISGEQEKVKAAVQAIRELIYSEGSGKEILVPKPLVGMVIGRQGEMIKNIQTKTGAKVQFKDDDPNAPHRIALVSGTMDAVEEAAQFIEELLSNAHMGGGGRGRGRGRGGFRGGRGGFGGRGGYGGGGGGYGRGGDHVEHMVPSNKCGIIIGRGGETIKSIMDQSGAHVEVNRNEDMNPPGSTIFFISGNPDQIQHAQRIIDEKLNSGPPGMHGGPGPGGHNMGPGGHRGGGGYGNHGPPGPSYGGGGHPPPPQQQQQPYNAPWGNSYQQPQQQQQPWQQPAQQQPPQEAPKPAPAPQQQQQWNPYYNYYQQPAQQPAAQPAPAPAQQPAAAPATTQAAAQPAVAPGTMPGQAPPPQTQDPNQLAAYYRQQAAQAESAAQAALANPPQPGQPDFTQQWADYYRQLATFYNSQATAVLQGGAAAPAVPAATAQQGYQQPAATTQPQQAYQPTPTSSYQPAAAAPGGYQAPTSGAPAYQAYQPPAQ